MSEHVGVRENKNIYMYIKKRWRETTLIYIGTEKLLSNLDIDIVYVDGLKDLVDVMFVVVDTGQVIEITLEILR